MDKCKALNLYRFHKDAVSSFLAEGGKMAAYVHEGYAASIRSVADYYQCSMDMLNGELRRQLFPAERPVRTRAPLLLGQSVLQRLGKIEIDNQRQVLKITTK